MPEPEERKALTMERVVERLGRTTAFVGRMMKAGELRPLPGNPTMFVPAEVERAAMVLERRRKAIEEIRRMDDLGREDGDSR